MKAKFTEVHNWSRQAANDAVEWQKVRANESKERLEAYGIGYQQGFMEAVKVLKMHGYLDVDCDK